jgi:hypothetical protein
MPGSGAAAIENVGTREIGIPGVECEEVAG